MVSKLMEHGKKKGQVQWIAMVRNIRAQEKVSV
jgi:hypothetical protein